MRTNARTAIVGSVVLVAAQLQSGPVEAAEPTVVNFVTPGEHAFVVPDGVTVAHVVLVGAPGGHGGAGGGAGGFGHRVEGDLAVEPGGTLFVLVGGPGGDGSSTLQGEWGFNGGGLGGDELAGLGTPGGGGGGGASDIRTVAPGIAGTAESSLVIAAGGGGGGGGSGGGAGGSAGEPGSSVSGAVGGGSATQSAGGPGGATGLGTDGSNGGFRFGGSGGDNEIGPRGGGGGGGYYGGGGGQGGVFASSSAAGGGGGSSYTDELADASVVADLSGIASVTISYTPDSSGTVNAEVTVPAAVLCLALSATTINFGTLPLGAESQPAAPQITVTNCAEVSETIVAAGTDAAGDGALWTLVDSGATCTDTLGLDNYRLAVQGTGGTLGLATTGKSLETLAAGSSSDQTALIYTACPGSSGGGTTMNMQLLFTAISPT